MCSVYSVVPTALGFQSPSSIYPLKSKVVLDGSVRFPVFFNVKFRVICKVIYFRQYDEEFIGQCSSAVRKVAENYQSLL